MFNQTFNLVNKNNPKFKLDFDMFLTTFNNYSFSSLARKLITSAIILSSLLVVANASAQYTEVRRFGTSQAICKGGIETGAELQAFFANNPDKVKSILNHAGWSGDPQVLFDAIASGDFTENKYAPGTTFEWMSAMRNGQAVSLPKRVWAGKDAFDGFEVNVVSQSVNYQMIIPHLCCNLSLAKASKIVENVQPTPVPAPVVASAPAAAKVIPFLAPFIGAESLMRYETRWAMDMNDSSGLFGLRGGIKYAIGKGLYLVPALGIFSRTSVNEGIEYPEEGASLDLGIEKYVSKSMFLGAGVGAWNVDDSDYRQSSIFLNAGGDISQATEWFLELRGIDSDNVDGKDGMSDNHAYNAGLRYKF